MTEEDLTVLYQMYSRGTFNLTGKETQVVAGVLQRLEEELKKDAKEKKA